MRFVIVSLFLIIRGVGLMGQNTCEMGFVTDTLYIETTSEFKPADALITPVLSNGSQLKLFKVANRYFLLIEQKENLYFDKVGDLEIVSGKKSMLQRGVKQYQKNKFTSFFVFEVFKNYINTLKEDGVTEIIFSSKSSKFNKNDVKEIKKVAACFYQTINVSNSKN